MKNSILKRRITHWVLPACTVFLSFGVVTSCSDDLLTGTPSWLGESIYSELESRGNFKETLKLIDAQDEDYASVLKKTGSKTMFVADDEAWEQFYENNAWGVTSIEEMTEAQKKLLFKSNMINSAYLVELLGNLPSASASEDPQEGACMRRTNSVNIMDSVPLVKKADFPPINPARVDAKTGKQIDYWSRLRPYHNDEVRILQDDGVATMIHFMPKFMQNNNITSEDVAFLTNGGITSNSDAFINGKVITEKDIVCQNGYIHQLEGVALPMDNMANVIANTKDADGTPTFSIFSRLLDRFSYPHYDATQSAEYQRQYKDMGATEDDSVFVKRYFNSHQGHRFTSMDDGTVVQNQLPYDPGWNRYSLYSAGGAITYQQDAAAILAPSDAAMRKYLQTDGADLEQRYGPSTSDLTAWDNAPDAVVLPLLENVMLTSLKSAIPSNFASINNSASEPMGVQKEDIDEVIWACNGVIYKTNKVYVAPAYVSVFYPAIIRADEDLFLTYTVVTNDNKVAGGEGFYAYLNNMGNQYAFFIPTDNALQYYFDPVSYKRTDAKGNSTALAYKFGVNTGGYISAVPYLVDWTTLDEYGRGTIGAISDITLSTSTSSSGDVFNHFKDILNSSLCVVDPEDGQLDPQQRFYQAKNGGPIILRWEGDQVTGVAGSFQYERGYYIPVTQEYDKSSGGNGKSYIIDEEPLMSTFTSPYMAITENEEFASFANLLKNVNFLNKDAYSQHATMDYCLTNLNNYHYTIYVPTNESIDALVNAHKLPTQTLIDDLSNVIRVARGKYDEAKSAGDAELMEEIEADTVFMKEQKTQMVELLNNFVKYHIQDNSVYMYGKRYNGAAFESACLNTKTSRFFKITVDYTKGSDELTVTDEMHQSHAVDPNNCNILTRQYYFDGADLSKSSQIYSSSFAVIHSIDTPLEYSENCYYDPDTYDELQAVMAKYPVASGAPSFKSIKRKR